MMEPFKGTDEEYREHLETLGEAVRKREQAEFERSVVEALEAWKIDDEKEVARIAKIMGKNVRSTTEAKGKSKFF